MRCIGIDGARGGWVGAVLDAGETQPHAWIAARIDVLDAMDPATTWVAIDMPIGLPDAGPRACEALTRRALGPRRSSVFPVPIRPMLAAADYAQACAIGRATDGRALSRQAWNITPRIRELDDWLARHSAWQNRVVEAHPELAFARLNGGTPLAAPKRRAAGADQRRALLQTLWPGAMTRLREAVPRAFAADDDLADALVLLTVARRQANGTAISLPDDPPRDARGLPMRIVV